MLKSSTLIYWLLSSETPGVRVFKGCPFTPCAVRETLFLFGRFILSTPLPPAMPLTDRIPCWEWGPLPGFTVTGLSVPSARPGVCDLPLIPVEYKLSLGNFHSCSEKVVGVIHLLLRWRTAGLSPPRGPEVWLLWAQGVRTSPPLPPLPPPYTYVGEVWNFL